MTFDVEARKAWLDWAQWGLEFTVDIARTKFLSRRTGKLQDDVKKTSKLLPSKDGFVLAADLFYIRFLETGAKAHTVRPRISKGRKFLKFQVVETSRGGFMSGRAIFAKKAEIPRLVPREPLLKTVQFAEKALEAQLSARSTTATLRGIPDRTIEVEL